MTTPQDDQAALDIARGLAHAGIPIFIAPPSSDPKDTSGFRLPGRWQQTKPDPSVLDHWQPGWAVCAVMGHGIDLVDLDLYAGAETARIWDALQAARHYGMAGTASGGIHVFVASLGVRSKNALFQGIDIKAGEAGKGHGFAFIAPTVKPSKVTGQLSPYYWQTPPDLNALIECGQDQSGQALAALITAHTPAGQILAAANSNGNGNGNGHSTVDPRALADPFKTAKISPWRDVQATLRNFGRNDGVMRLAAALRGQGGWEIDAAIAHMYEKVWPFIDQAQGGHEFPAEEFEATIRAQWRQYPDGVLRAIADAEEHTESTDWPVPGSVLELSDTYVSDTVERCCLRGKFLWARGLGWLRWTGLVWSSIDVGIVHDFLGRGFREWNAIAATGGAEHAVLSKLSSFLSVSKIRAIADLVHGHPLITHEAEDFDAYPDAVNTPDCIVDLRTGDTWPNDPRWMLTKITSGRYVPEYVHEDWEQALTALDAPERAWFKARIGQSITGHPPSDGIMPILQGTGENGKTCCTTDGPVRALGDYADMASHKLITSHKPGASEHSTEMADLRGQRLLIGEELSEGRSIDVTALKRIMDVGRIKARYVHKDNITFTASHSLMVTTNYEPDIYETDHGTWRRMALLKFRYTYRKTPEAVTKSTDKLGDPGLKQRIRQNLSGQHDAIVTWAIEGAREWYRRGYTDAPITERIRKDTLTWRIKTDRILGFCTEKLEPDHNACILATDMLAQFNEWLTSNGHNALTKETFASRFSGHEWVTRNGVENRRTAALGGLVPWPVPGGFQHQNQVPKQPSVWAGVRPRTDPEQGKEGQLAEVAYLPPNSPEIPIRGEFGTRYATSASDSRVTSTEAPSASPGSTSTGSAQSDDPLGTQMGTADHDSVREESSAVVTQRDENVDPPRPENPGTVSPPEPETPGAVSPPQVKKPRKPRAPKPPKRIGPDPELAGPVHALPAAVNREGSVLSCTLEQARQLAGPRSNPDRGGRRTLTVDVETTGYPIGHPDYRLRTVQLGGEDVAVVFDADDPEHQAVIRELLAAAEILHAHSAVADLVPLERAGLCGEDAWLKMDDTVLRAKLADPRQSGSDADGLKQLAADVVPGAVIPEANEARKKLFASGKWLTDTDALTPPERSGWGQVDSGCETMIVYAASDVLDTAPLPRLLPPVDPRILAREQVVQRICARVSHRGLRLDGEHIRELAVQHETAKAEVAERLRVAGIENPGSAQQVGRALAERGVTLPRTKPSATHPDGQPSAAEAVLTPLAAGITRDVSVSGTTVERVDVDIQGVAARIQVGLGVRDSASFSSAELAADVLAYREHATILGLTLNPFRVLCERGDGRVRPTIYTLGTNTGRMSAVRPNLQQIKRTGGLRACITADEGMVLVSADFQAVELRVAAALAQDQALYEMITEGDKCRVQQLLAKAAGNAEAAAYWKDQASLFDLHWKIARQVWGPQAGKGDRYNAKRSVFGRLYGAGIRKIAATLGISEGEARAVADTLDALAPGVAHWSAEMQQYVRNGGTSIQAYSGRTIWLDKGVAHKAANYAIQGNAREALADGLLKWEQTQWAGSVILPVHDEIVTVVPAADAAEATRTLVEVMSTELNGMKIIAEPSEPSFAWADAS